MLYLYTVWLTDYSELFAYPVIGKIVECMIFRRMQYVVQLPLEYYVNSVPLYRYGNYLPALACVNLRSAQASPSVKLPNSRKVTNPSVKLKL